MYKFFSKICALLLMGMLCAACGSQIASEQGSAAVLVDNFTFFGEPQRVSVPKPPSHAVVYGASALDTLLALQVGDRVAAAVIPDDLPVDEYQKRLPNTKIYRQTLSIEKIMELQPDFLLAWRRIFADNKLGDTSAWLRRGIPAYIQDASGPIPAKGKFPACTVDSEVKFIRNMGIIFDRQRNSEKIIADIQARLNRSVSLQPNANKVLVIEFINGTIEVFGQDLLSGDIIKRFGGDVIEYGAAFISQEELMIMEADYVFVVYHGGEQEAVAALRNFSSPLYRHLRAVKEGRVYSLNYRLIVAPGVNVVKTLDYIQGCLFAKH